MSIPAKTPQQPKVGPGHDKGDAHANGGPHPPEPAPTEQTLGEQLLREARDGQAEFVAGWEEFMQELGIRGKPIGAQKLREPLLAEGVDAKQNEFSQGIIAMREE